LELELIQKTEIGIGIDSGKHELELIKKIGIGIGIDYKNRNWN
jgi:hypothetical protein